jgi:hypothetical protein
MQESCPAANRLAHASAHARLIVTFAGDAAEGCTGSTWAFAHGDNFGRVYAASVTAQRDAVNLLEGQLFPNVPKLENGENTAQEKTQLVQ